MQTTNWALQAGRLLQRKQTGYIHYCAQSEDGTHDTIPVLENALFALALFRSRLADNVLEGKTLLEKLLKFAVDGNFPVYLHDYPQLSDPFLNLRLLPVLFWIRVDFAHVIGDLKQELDSIIERILEKTPRDSLPGWGISRFLAFEGKQGPAPKGVFEWSEALISLQIAEKHGMQIDKEIKKAFALWHPRLHLYTGPALRRHQRGSEPDLTLFDLFLSQWQKDFPKRCEALSPLHLRGALIRPLSFSPEIDPKPIPFIHFNEEEEWPLFIAWKGSEGMVHTFALAKKHLTVSGTCEEVLIMFPEERPDTEDKSLEINAFLNHHADQKIFVQGVKATTFQMEEEVEIRSSGMSLRLCFEGIGGKFFGHILRGNRPSQHRSTGQPFTAYDWRIAIRTLSREKSATMRVRVSLQQEPENPQRLPSHASHYPHTESSL